MITVDEIRSFQKQLKKVGGQLNKSMFQYSAGKIEFEVLEQALDQWIDLMCQAQSIINEVSKK